MKLNIPNKNLKHIGKYMYFGIRLNKQWHHSKNQNRNGTILRWRISCDSKAKFSFEDSNATYSQFYHFYQNRKPNTTWDSAWPIYCNLTSLPWLKWTCSVFVPCPPRIAATLEVALHPMRPQLSWASEKRLCRGVMDQTLGSPASKLSLDCCTSVLPQSSSVSI